MNNTFYFLRHGKTKVDKNTPISKWVLSAEGEKQAQQRADEGIFDKVDLIFTSTENKALQTAKPIADKLGKNIEQLKELNELDRDQGKFLSPEEYEKEIEHCLSHQSESTNNWETAQHALARFEKRIEDLDRKFENKQILIVGHGFTINLYFAKLVGTMDKVYERLNTNDFADWGIVKNKKVLKDIAPTP